MSSQLRTMARDDGVPLSHQGEQGDVAGPPVPARLSPEEVEASCPAQDGDSVPRHDTRPGQECGADQGQAGHHVPAVRGSGHHNNKIFMG